MAPVVEGRSRADRTAHKRAPSPEPYPWTVGDDFEGETPPSRYRRAFHHNKKQIRAEVPSLSIEAAPTEAPAYPPPDSPPPEGNPDGDTSGDDDSGIDSESEDERPDRPGRPDWDGPSPTRLPSGSFPELVFPEPTKDLSLDSDSDDDDEGPVTSHLPTDTGGLTFPSETDWVSGPPSSTTSSIGEQPTADAARQAQKKHHRDVEKALTAVGSIAGAVVLAAAVWFLWRFMKRRKARKNQDMMRPLFLGKDQGDTAWTTVKAPQVDFDEKKPSDASLLGILPDEPKRATLRPLILPTRQQNQTRQPPPPPLDLSPDSNPNPTYDSAQTYPSRTYGTYDTRYSFGSSSLSSAFGNGTFMLPSPSQAPHDSVYARSERSLPRFRTIDSWVGQQMGRVRSKVPEQGFGLMMPDDEKARRVVAPNGVGFG